MASRPARLGTLLLVAVLLGACGPFAGAGRSRGCGTIEDLDAIAAGFGRTDPADPEVFDRALGAATDRYIATGRDLRGRLPEELREGLDRHLVAVRQYRFADAAADRRAIDAWAADECGRTASTSTTP